VHLIRGGRSLGWLSVDRERAQEPQLSWLTANILLAGAVGEAVSLQFYLAGACLCVGGAVERSANGHNSPSECPFHPCWLGLNAFMGFVGMVHEFGA
jgi:hypothetical protein